MLDPAALIAAFQRFVIRSFETSDEKRRMPRRWWVIDESTVNYDVNYPGDVIGSPDGYTDYADARLAQVKAVLDHLGIPYEPEKVVLPAFYEAMWPTKTDEGGGP